MKRPKQTDKECRRQGMHDVPVANYSKMQDKYIDYLEKKKVKNNSVLDYVIKCLEYGDEIYWKGEKFYFIEGKDTAVLIGNYPDVENKHYNDWWVNKSEVDVF
jgi:hypothetical protein